MDNKYIEQPPKNYKSECHWRTRLIERVLEVVPEDKREDAMKSLENYTDDKLKEFIAELAKDGQIEPAEMAYHRIDDPIIQDAGLSVGATALYCILCSYTPWPKRVCWPSLDLLARRFGTNRVHIVKWRNELVERGHLSYVAGKGRRSNTYYLLHRDELVESEGARTAERVNARKQRRFIKDAA